MPFEYRLQRVLRVKEFQRCLMPILITYGFVFRPIQSGECKNDAFGRVSQPKTIIDFVRITRGTRTINYCAQALSVLCVIYTSAILHWPLNTKRTKLLTYDNNINIVFSIFVLNASIVRVHARSLCTPDEHWRHALMSVNETTPQCFLTGCKAKTIILVVSNDVIFNTEN